MKSFFKKKTNDFNHIDLLKIAKYYNGPFWIYNANIIKEQIMQLQCFDVIRFAQKACSNINILKLMRTEGVKIDSVSLGEIHRALASGYLPIENNIIFTSDVLDNPTLLSVVDLNIPVNAGSLDMLSQLGKISPGHKVWIRINPGFGHGYHRKTNTGGNNSKHGIWYNDIPSALLIINKYKLKLIGLHMHIGSGVDYSHLKKVCDSMVYYVTQLNQDIQAISAGGGLSIPYQYKIEKKVDIKHYFNLWNNSRNIIASHLKHDIQLEIEPGRFLVAESGFLISKIYAIKSTNNRNFILIDAGFNDLIRPSMYGSYHHISLIPNDGRDISKCKKIDTVIAGPLCESGDIFTQTKNGLIQPRRLPLPKVGDYLIFHDVGAYGSSMSSNYNSRPLIPEVLFNNGEFQEIRRAQTIEELLSLEKIKK